MAFNEETQEFIFAKRDLTHAAASIFSAFFLVCKWNVMDADVHSNQTLPVQMIGFIVGMELLKILFSVGLHPRESSPFYSESDSYLVSVFDTGELNIPLICTKSRMKKPTDGNGNRNSSTMLIKILEGVKGILSLLISIGLCHILFVLFGAPFIQDWMLTLQFSIILASWLVIPFFSIIRPASVLPHLYYMSSWSESKGTLLRHKWRFILTILGTWIGAVVIPLDWDMKWQKWPIPCLYSATLAHILINLIYGVYLFSQLYGQELRKLLPKARSKVKAI